MRLRYCLVLIWAFIHISVTGAAEPFRYPEGKYGKGELKYIHGLPVLTVSGSPEEIGEAAGVLALKPAAPVASYPEGLLKEFHLGFLRYPFLVAGENMVQKFPDNYRRELEAMARASGVEREKLVLGNTLFDLKKIMACSALLVDGERSATGGPLLGRNLDYPSLGYMHEYSLVTIYRPDGARHAFASVGFPGLVGCLSGMNDAGLAVAVLEVFQVKAGNKRTDLSGMPYALCYRSILENCATIAEAKQLLESLPRTTITNLVVADRTGIAVFEVTPGCVQVRRPVKGLCVCTNHFCSPELKPLASFNLHNSAERYKVLEEASLATDGIGVAALHRHLHATHKQDTLQAMVFEPAVLHLHLAIGICPASVGEMRLLELGPLFKEGKP